jgi:hypothetical protein
MNRRAIFLLGMVCIFSDGRYVALGAKAHNRHNISAGFGEKSFSEEYRLNLKLPMAEADFLLTLRRLNLRYDICGDRNKRIEIPPPRHDSGIDLHDAIKCYQIYGSRGSVERVAKVWRAFANKKSQVFYIENVFAYVGP